MYTTSDTINAVTAEEEQVAFKCFQMIVCQVESVSNAAEGPFEAAELVVQLSLSQTS